MKKGIKILIISLVLTVGFVSFTAYADDSSIIKAEDVIKERLKLGAGVAGFNMYYNEELDKTITVVKFTDGSTYVYGQNSDNSLDINGSIKDSDLDYKNYETFSNNVGGTASGDVLSTSTIYECNSRERNYPGGVMTEYSGIPYSFDNPGLMQSVTATYKNSSGTEIVNNLDCFDPIEYDLLYSSDKISNEMNNVVNNECFGRSAGSSGYLTELSNLNSMLDYYRSVFEECVNRTGMPSQGDISSWMNAITEKQALDESLTAYTRAINDGCDYIVDHLPDGSAEKAAKLNSAKKQLSQQVIGRLDSEYVGGSKSDSLTNLLLEEYSGVFVTQDFVTGNSSIYEPMNEYGEVISLFEECIVELNEIVEERKEDIDEEALEQWEEFDKKSKVDLEKAKQELWDGETYKDHIPSYSETFTWSGCESLISAELKKTINKLLGYVRIIVPILTIVLGMLDFGKAVFASNEDTMKKAQITFVKRLIIAVAIFFVPNLVDMILNAANGVWSWIQPGCGY